MAEVVNVNDRTRCVSIAANIPDSWCQTDCAGLVAAHPQLCAMQDLDPRADGSNAGSVAALGSSCVSLHPAVPNAWCQINCLSMVASYPTFCAAQASDDDAQTARVRSRRGFMPLTVRGRSV